MMNKTTLSITWALFIATSFSARAAKKIQTPADQARTTLSEIEESTVNTAREADPIGLLAGGLSQDSHYDHLMTIKDDINRMGTEISILDAESESLALWEKQALDKVEPLLRETAANAQKATTRFEQDKRDFWKEDYRGYVNGVEQGSEQIAETLKAYLKYGKAHEQEEQFKQSLGVGQ